MKRLQTAEWIAARSGVAPGLRPRIITRRSTIILGGITLLYWFSNLGTVVTIAPDVGTIFAPDLVALTAADSSFLVFGVLSVWIVVALSASLNGRRLEHILRYGSRSRLLYRVGFVEGATAAGIWVGVIYVILGSLSLLTAGGEARLFGDLPPLGGQLFGLHLAHAVKLALFLVVTRMLLTACALFARRAAIAVGVLIWILCAWGSAFSDSIPAAVNPTTLMNLLPQSSEVDLQVRGFCTLLIVGGLIWGLTRGVDAVTGDAPATIREKLRHPRLWWGDAPIRGVFVLVLAAVVAGVAWNGSGNGESSFGDVLVALFGGYRLTLVQALLETVFTMGFVWWLLLADDQRQQSGWAEAVLLRRGSRRRAFVHRLGEQARALAVYVISVSVVLSLVFGAVNGNFASGNAGIDAVQGGAHLLINGTGQIAIYLLIVTLVRAISSTRIVAIVILAALVVFPLPGVVSVVVPLHRFGVAPLADGGWEWILTVALQNTILIVILIALGYVFADGPRAALNKLGVQNDRNRP
ncbi:hypothetical protein D9V32_14705 [Mycetocola tolaasinivorans]|uniref:Uncharacterized protein n=1 Tax=Mycetocola tolaasinivorans TaxID=76635 RepID=A0A3L7A048_9MICO|nr:hypothetical protein [Mycetocola tolaasinivorans]RLP73350.1 hypothetical protein D9V32_14705 [Mycetocola tolaasinivorans]